MLTTASKFNFTFDKKFVILFTKHSGRWSIKTKIVELRQLHNLTQAELAQKVKVSRQTIISIETDRYNPSIFLAHNIAKVFKMPIEEVFLFEDGED